jgi:cob(I)alamin adenosyltransferase
VASVKEDEELCKLHAKATSANRLKSMVFTRLSQKMKSLISRVSLKQTPQIVVEPSEEITQNHLQKEMEEWIDEYQTEINKVELFYKQKIEEYKLEFKMLKLSLKT